MSEASVVRPLLNELSKGTAKEKAKALSELKGLALTEAVRSEFIVMGHVPTIINVLNRGDMDCRMHAAGILANVAATDACRAAIIAAGALEPLVGMLSKSISGLQEEAAGALRNLAESVQGQHAIIALGALAPLVMLLSSGTAKGKQNAGCTIGHLATHLPKAEINGFMPSLVAMLSSDEDGVCMEASRAISKISTTCPNRAAVMKADALAPLVHLLSKGSLKSRAEAAAALGNLSEEGTDFEPTGEPPPAFAGAIADAGAVPPLVTLLGPGEGRPDESVDLAISNNALMQAARTLSFLAIEAKTHPVLVAAGAIPALVALLQEGKGTPLSKGWAASALEQLGRDAEVKKEIYASVPTVAKTPGGQKSLIAQLKFYCQ